MATVTMDVETFLDCLVEPWGPPGLGLIRLDETADAGIRISACRELEDPRLSPGRRGAQAVRSIYFPLEAMIPAIVAIAIKGVETCIVEIRGDTLRIRGRCGSGRESVLVELERAPGEAADDHLRN